MGERTAKRVAAWATLAAMPCLTWGFAVVAHDAAARVSASATPEAIVTTSFAALGAVITAYLSLVGAGATLVTPWGGTRAANLVTRSAPTAWRRVTATALGATLAGSLSLPAIAQPGTTSPVDWVTSDQVVSDQLVTTPHTGADAEAAATAMTVLDSTVDPDPSIPTSPEPATEPRESTEPDAGATQVIDPFGIAPKVTSGPPAVSARDAAERVESSTHIVARGESLWSITAAALGEGATTAQIARAWPLVYAANTELIGDDPGLIYAGQELVIPGELR